MRVFLNGGGDGPVCAEAYRRFARELDTSKPLLYVPLAMEPEDYPGCLTWITGELESLHVQIHMASSAEEMAGLDLSAFCGVFIGGGNTYTLVKRLKDSGAFPKLRAYMESGGPIFGGSAGAIIFGRDIAICQYEDENTAGLQDTAGLDVLQGLSLLCHYQDGKPVPPGLPALALREDQTLVIRDGLLEII